ncbi:MAG: PAS domain-containing protein [Dehalococcoidales bacterium]|nr:PAS domain-containing protein [Dehalococcoidales bacterium]
MAGDDSGDSQDLFNITGKINANDSLVSLIIKSCNEGIIIVQENQIEFVNNSFLSLTEYSQEEVFGKAFLDFIAPECRDEISVIHNDRISEESSLRIYETAFLTKSDEHVYVKVTASHFEYNGNPAVMVIFKDSSIRKENNDLTHSDTNFFDSIIEHSPNPMWVSDTCGNIIRINQALRDLMKITDEEIINNYNVLKDKQVEQQGYLDLVRKVFEEGIDAEFTLDYYTAREEQVSIQETTHRILEITLIPLKNSKGEITNVICLEKDITERVEATEALSESEEKYYLLFENTYDAILLTIPDGRIIAANPAACKMFGMTEEEICQSGRNGIVDLSDTRLTDAVKQRDDKGYFKGQLTFLRKDGSRFEGEVTSVIFDDSEGDPRSSMIIRDISEQNQAREELRIEKEKAESYLSIADIILLVIDENHLVSMINRKGCEILGYEHNEIIGTNWFDKYIPERYREKVNDYWNRFRRGDGDGLTTFENPVITKNREERIIFWHNTILTDNKGKFSGTLSSGQDITEWKLSDESLKESEKKNSIFTELTSDYVYVYTRDEKGQMVLDWIGGAFEQTTGYTPEEFKTMPVASNVHPDDRPALIDTQRKVMSGETTTLELRIIKKNGDIRWIFNQAQPIWNDDHTTVIAIYGAAHAITTRKLVEQNLINTNRALTVLSRCNEVLVHSTDEWNLLNEVCRIVVESGGYLFTWVGYRENDPEKSIGNYPLLSCIDSNCIYSYT